MNWQKLGLLYSPEPLHPKLVSHAANPLAVFLKDDIYRVFFSGRDLQNRSSVGFVDVDILQRKVVYIHDKPVFEHGPENSYYSHGVSIGSCYEAAGKRYILFMGWHCPPEGHWKGEIGRLLLNDDYSLCLDGEEPFMATDATDPLSLSYPWVLRGDDGQYHMWYGSTVTWDACNGEMLHVIKQATSADGQTWNRQGLAVPYEPGRAQAFSRPSVVGSNKTGYEMWFSCRSGSGETYRIGYAFSQDNRKWELALEAAGINVSESDWDSEMICYPFIFDHKGKRYMLYNGNGYGKTGFGLAVVKND